MSVVVAVQLGDIDLLRMVVLHGTKIHSQFVASYLSLYFYYPGLSEADFYECAEPWCELQ